MQIMTARAPALGPVLDALDRAPVGVVDLTPEQHAEFDVIAAEFAAGRLRLVPNAQVPRVLEELARERSE
jgi:hypothetical protein